MSSALRFSATAGLFDAPSVARQKGFGSCLAPCGAYPPCPAMLGLLKGAERQKLNGNGNGDGNGDGNGMAVAPRRV